ncbi:SusD/RagB family nutrient-binding outer membrane lipoprotein [Spirosoma sp. KCTC 42546]|uniref:SusD/RagB family nutrient-binding outer membrane lipoprotein n=1 Tax=Spirosoma sp. KCTC 42546 TaxID=2520506 RepID=UPI001156E461|nr:SusD/RagB family nutrient-binding outer membrane lipoprotein [Spirosoma sp. KCTC 42546]QDK77901.1 SusD/RagB family nutrient-binding outer membrane lipoprotein [Spirosoma sp. KCTC 42546]
MKRIYRSVFALLVGFQFFSCSSIVENLNVDPNNPTASTGSLLLTGTEIANMATQEGMASRLTTIWSGYATGADRQWLDYYNYNVTAGVYDADWNLVYQATNANALLTIEKATTLGNRKMAAIAKILRANALATGTELWGDIPFDQAGDILKYPSPAFEPQATVYTKLLALLDDAIADLKSGVGTVTTEDIHFGGDATKWTQVAYTLKARLQTDLKQYDAAYTTAQTGISAYANSLYAPHGNTANVNQNAYFSFLASSRTGDINAVGAYNTTLLNPTSAKYRGNSKTIETARFKFYYLEVGVNSPGKMEPNTTGTTGFFAQTASFPLVTYQENILTLAESALRSGKGFATALGHLNAYRAWLNTGGNINAAYLTAGSYKYEPYVAADFEAGGIENAAGGITADNALLREILEERYVSFYGQHVGWDDERRTRAEAYGIKLTPNNGTQLPWRFIYPQNELNSNANAPKPVPATFEAPAIYK